MTWTLELIKLHLGNHCGIERLRVNSRPSGGASLRPDQDRKVMFAGLPTGVYRPEKVSRPVPRSIRNDVMESPY